MNADPSSNRRMKTGKFRIAMPIDRTARKSTPSSVRSILPLPPDKATPANRAATSGYAGAASDPDDEAPNAEMNGPAASCRPERKIDVNPALTAVRTMTRRISRVIWMPLS